MSAAGTFFSRPRSVRVMSGIASVGALAGLSLVAATPASAATAADCTLANSVSSGVPADIQTLLAADTPIICLSGTFVLATPLVYDYDVTIFGLSAAVLDGNSTSGILQYAGANPQLTVENLRFTNGFAAQGGAINGYGVIVNNSRFDNNVATTNGGAISAYGVEISDSVFEDNAAEDSGGAISGFFVTAVRSSTFDGNSASLAGGAIASYGTFTVENSTFVDNSSEGAGGGAVASGNGGSVVQSTFLDNSSVASGQSIDATGSQPLVLLGNIFAAAGTDPHLTPSSTNIVDDGGNLFTTSQATESALGSVQPSTQFDLTTLAIFNGATLADNGGPTRTVALYSGSPAINAVAAGSLSTDQRGVTRPAVSDAGAYEFVAPVLAATGSVPSGWLGGAAALLLAAGALALGLARRVVRAR